MKGISLNQGWYFGLGTLSPGDGAKGLFGDRKVNLPHDYMIESDVFPGAPAGNAGGYYSAGPAWYAREVEIPAEWAEDRILLRVDGAMMNATVEVNGNKAALHHYGYSPFEVDLTELVYPGKKNRILITVNPSMQPNSRWYSGAGLFRGVTLGRAPKLRLAFGGISAWTRKIEYTEQGAAETAFLQAAAEVRNERAENRMAEVTFALIREADGKEVIARKTLTRVEPLSEATARMTLTVDQPALWSAETPALYRLRVTVRDVGTFKTHIVPEAHPTEDAEEVLFGIRTVEADVRHGLRINGKSVKLRGGCLHHDNGVIGAVSLYDAEARKLRKLKEAGFNAIRTTHNPPSVALIEACDRLGVYVFDEAFDAWGMGKQPGDYNQFFETDWERDLADFIRRDRCHPSVILWSTGNEITERAGLGKGYTLANRLAEAIRRLDPSRPVSNAVCSFWNGLDDDMLREMMAKWESASDTVMQNADLGKEDLTWEQATEAFVNGLDIVGYNYLEDRYETDHALFPERVILGSENFPKEIGIHWPVIERTSWIIGDFTWTAWDYIGEAGIGKAVFFDPDNPSIPDGKSYLVGGSPFPRRTANDADFDITGRILPQGVYRRIIWGSGETAVFSYDPDHADKTEVISNWGFPGVQACWNWPGREGKPVDLLVFTLAEEAELIVNGKSCGRLKAGEAEVHGMPHTFRFRTVYTPGRVEAVGYTGGREVSRSALETAGTAKKIHLIPETTEMRADGMSLCYVRVEVTDGEGRIAPDAGPAMRAEASGAAELLGFGSGNPITEENYTRGQFSAFQGSALAVLRAGYETGEASLTVRAEGFDPAEIRLTVK